MGIQQCGIQHRAKGGDWNAFYNNFNVIPQACNIRNYSVSSFPFKHSRRPAESVFLKCLDNKKIIMGIIPQQYFYSSLIIYILCYIFNFIKLIPRIPRRGTTLEITHFTPRKTKHYTLTIQHMSTFVILSHLT